MAEFKFLHWPTEYPVITQHFGVNRQNYAQFGLPGHDGIDIRAPMGSKVFAVAPGQVFNVHVNARSHNYGIHVRVRHQDGYQTIYAHLQKALVREGQEVEAGHVLGLADNTGNSFGSHLHLTLKKEGARYRNWPHNIFDPTPFILPLLGWQEPAGPYAEGWVLTAGLIITDNLAQANSGGVTLRLDSNETVHVPAGTIMILASLDEVEPKLMHTRVKVARAAVGLNLPPPPEPEPEPPPTVATIEGWAWLPHLSVSKGRAVVLEPGINLRVAPDRNAPNIGLVRRFSTVVVSGAPRNNYLPVQARRGDFIGPILSSELPPLLERGGVIEVPSDSHLGWTATRFLSRTGAQQADISRFGSSLRSQPTEDARIIGLVKAFASVVVVGLEENDFTPILARKEDVLNAPHPMPPIQPPQLLPPDTAPDPLPQPLHDTTPGWTFTVGLQLSGDSALTGSYVMNLHQTPRRDSPIIGHIPPRAELIVTGPPQGEFTPVRVDDGRLQLPEEHGAQYDPPLLGRTLIGLHASTSAIISTAERQDFARMRPGLIKLLSFHSSNDARLLAEGHPTAEWIIRPALTFGGQAITPERFFEETQPDIERLLLVLQGKRVVLELHHKPNIAEEGLGASWPDGTAYSQWWLRLRGLYRQRFPSVPLLYPGLSLGPAVRDIKQDHIRFIEASREAAETADGLAVHLYWSDVYPMAKALDSLDDYINRFRGRPIWVTEASNNSRTTPPQRKAIEYLNFWKELQSRPIVEGVTYFVASTENPQFINEAWLGRGIAAIVGRR